MAAAAAPGAKQQQTRVQQGLLAEKEEDQVDDSGSDAENEEVYAPKLVASGYVAAPGET